MRGLSLGAETAVYVTNVDGVIISGRVARRLRAEELHGIEEQGTGSGIDVTGGMARKLEALRANACPGLRRVWVVNGLAPGRLEQLLRSGEAPGTEILL